MEVPSSWTPAMVSAVTNLMKRATTAPGRKDSAGVHFCQQMRHDTYDFIKPEQFDLQGRAVLITGASKGYGRALAKAYAQAGASFIAIGARSSLSATEKDIYEIAATTGKTIKVLPLKLDVTSRSDVESARDQVRYSFGRLDILINNAGCTEKWMPFLKSSPEDWWKTWETNVFGTFLATQLFLPLLLETESNSLRTILNISSISAVAYLEGGTGSYSGTKLAVLRLTEYLTYEFESQGLICFALHPGGMKTDILEDLPQAWQDLSEDRVELGAHTSVWLTAERREWLAGRYVSAVWDMEEFVSMEKVIVKEDLLKSRLDTGRAEDNV